MADAKRCDRCGGFYERMPDERGERSFNVIRMNYMDSFGGGEIPRKRLDLCPYCLDSFLSWMSQGKVKEAE